MALQGVITPSVAGVYGVRDFSQQLANANAGVRNLANFALNQVSNAVQRNAQANEAEKQRDFQALEAEKSRIANRNLQEANWAHNDALMKRQEELQNKKEKDAFRSDALPVVSMQIDETNPSEIRAKLNRLDGVIEKAKSKGDFDTLAAANQEKIRLGGMYTKDSDGKLVGGVLQDAEANQKKVKLFNDTDKTIKEHISAGASNSAVNQIKDALEKGIISEADVQKYEALIAAKENEMRIKAENESFNRWQKGQTIKKENESEVRW